MFHCNLQFPNIHNVLCLISHKFFYNSALPEKLDKIDAFPSLLSTACISLPNLGNDRNDIVKGHKMIALKLKNNLNGKIHIVNFLYYIIN